MFKGVHTFDFLADLSLVEPFQLPEQHYNCSQSLRTLRLLYSQFELLHIGQGNVVWIDHFIVYMWSVRPIFERNFNLKPVTEILISLYLL